MRKEQDKPRAGCRQAAREGWMRTALARKAKTGRTPRWEDRQAFCGKEKYWRGDGYLFLWGVRAGELAESAGVGGPKGGCEGGMVNGMAQTLLKKQKGLRARAGAGAVLRLINLLCAFAGNNMQNSAKSLGSGMSGLEEK
jgi:hypothetical protein